METPLPSCRVPRDIFQTAPHDPVEYFPGLSSQSCHGRAVIGCGLSSGRASARELKEKQGRFLIFQTDLETKVLCCYSFKSSGILASSPINHAMGVEQ
jgi:hypothetical protein